MPASAGRHLTIDDLMKYRNASAVELSPDGSRAVFVVTQPNFDENVMRSNLYLLGASGAAIQLTNGPRHDEQPRWSSDGKWIAFISDRDVKPAKAGKRQVWVISSDGGEAWQLTRGTQTIVAVEWAPDGKHLAVVATEAPSDEEEKRTRDKDDAVIVDHNHKMGRIYLISVPDGKAELLYAGDRHITSISFSPRGDEIAFADQPTPKWADFYLRSVIGVINVGTKQVRAIAGAPFSNAYPQFSPDGNMVAFLGLSPTDLLAWRLYVVRVTGGAARRVAADVGEDIQEFRWADDSATLYFSASHGMDRHIYRAALDGKAQQVDRFPIGVARDIAIRNGKLAFVYESPSQGAEVYTATLGRGELAATQRTEMNPYLADLSLGKTEVVRWKNKKDGMAMEGLLVTPPDYQPGKAYPLLVVIHGGPTGQFDTGFRLWYQRAYPVHVFASQGYIVFKPNPRGSSGWGAKFREANLKDFGGADYHDIQDGVDELIARGIADRDHMGVMGWSYGGYMTAWTITQTSRFRAASVGAGLTNLYSMYGTFPFFFEWYFGGPPWEARELYMARSPMTFVNRATTPTLIQHGTEDPGVPISQGQELYTALRARGIAVEMIRYPRSAHVVTEPKLIRDMLTRNLEWFDRYVRGNAQAAKWHTPAAPTSTPPAQ
ncbi:MAG: S9 family peptidase [Terriglobales bacterium]